ncbi:MAG TPA: hypothetical protein VHF69_09385 [Candidatus Synoicihabitans sp.]|nr:hypothetical protein [Candidatus Synoicihabitans sp.]
MAVKTRAQLKARFETRKTPTQQDFYDLIDSMALNSDDRGEPGGVAPLDEDGKIPEEFLPTITAQPFSGAFVPLTALTGGGVGALDALETADGEVETGSIAFAIAAGEFSTWQLQDGTAAEDAAVGVVRPDDYNATTNARVWIRIA